MEENQIELAEESANISLKISKETKDKEAIYSAYDVLSKVLEKKGDFKNSIFYKKLFIQYKDSVQSYTTKNALMIYENDQQELQRKLLEERKQSQKITNYTLTIGIILSLLIAFTLYLSRKRVVQINNKLKFLYSKLESKTNELRIRYTESIQQTEIIEQQNKELISKRELIHRFNNHLESIIEERTYKLKKTNEQLKEYAFFNAHKFRAPVARILGLCELLNLINSEAEKEDILHKIQMSAHLLDQMVKEGQRILDSKGYKIA